MRPVHSDAYMARRFDVRSSNCWHLVRDVWREATGIDLGDLTPAQTDTESLHGAARAAVDGPQFERLSRPRSPCIVLMRRRAEMPHVGVLLRLRVLHLTPDGARHQWLSDVAREWESVEFYVPRQQPEAA